MCPGYFLEKLKMLVMPVTPVKLMISAMFVTFEMLVKSGMLGMLVILVQLSFQ